MNKNLLPTLLPILAGIIVLVSPQARDAVIHFVAAHPIAGAIASVISLIVNHWLPSPTEETNTQNAVKSALAENRAIVGKGINA